MYGIITENQFKNEESSKNKIFDISLLKIYFILLACSFVLIYYHYIYQGNYLAIQMTYASIWPILMILIGLSIFKAKDILSFIIGIGFVIFALILTLTSIFISSSSIVNNEISNIFSSNESDKLAVDMNFMSSKINIDSIDNPEFKLDFISNYDTLNSSNYIDTNNVQNINIDQNIFPPGIGAYNKNTDIVFPTDVPIGFKMGFNLSSIKADFSNITLESGAIKINNSILDMVIKDLNMDEDVVLEIDSNFSIIDITISKDIPVILSYSSNLSQGEFMGIAKNSNRSNVYETVITNNVTDTEVLSDENTTDTKKLIINLNSNISRIKVTQK